MIYYKYVVSLLIILPSFMWSSYNLCKWGFHVAYKVVKRVKISSCIFGNGKSVTRDSVVVYWVISSPINECLFCISLASRKQWGRNKTVTTMRITSQRNYLAAPETINYTDNEHVEKGRTALLEAFILTRFFVIQTLRLRILNWFLFKMFGARVVIVRPIRRSGGCSTTVVSFPA